MWHIQLKAVKCIVFSRFPFLSEALQSLQQFIKTLITISGRKLIETTRLQSKAYMLFCEIFISDLFSVPSDKCPLYIAFSTKSLTSYGSLCNYLEVIVQPNLSLSDDKNFLSNYEVQLMTLRKS